MSVAAATKKHGSKRRYARGEGGTAGDARRGVGRRRAGSRVVKSEHDIVEVVLARRGRDELEDLTVLERLALLDLRGRKGASRRARGEARRATNPRADAARRAMIWPVQKTRIAFWLTDGWHSMVCG